jgi:CDP-paratose 2-epimerase
MGRAISPSEAFNYQTNYRIEPKVTLITGGAGFIGSNLAKRLSGKGKKVLIFDNLSRLGVDRNLRHLLQRHPSIQAELSDIRDIGALERSVAQAEEIFHFAAQVAVTSSIDEPFNDFDVNLRGTVMLLDMIRRKRKENPPRLIFTSTNKVYGRLSNLPLRETKSRYEVTSPEVEQYGINENSKLEFCSPYGCSKGAADQYVLDFAKTYNLPMAVFRMSCIYGPYQQGSEDQGWIAHFIRQTLKDNPLMIYGSGKQVRDILYVEDLLDAFEIAMQRMELIKGRAFNIGGGPHQAVSLAEVINLIEVYTGKHPRLEFRAARLADQNFYVSDLRNFQRETGWMPKVSPQDGIERLTKWYQETEAEWVRPVASYGSAASGRQLQGKFTG